MRHRRLRSHLSSRRYRSNAWGYIVCATPHTHPPSLTSHVLTLGHEELAPQRLLLQLYG